MSKLTDKIFLMRNMDDEELKDYIKILTDNEKDLIIYSAIKMIISDEFNRAFQNLNKIEEYLLGFQVYLQLVNHLKTILRLYHRTHLLENLVL